MAIPALMAKKTGTPVMMRITREEEHYIGRARAGMQGRARIGFRKDGRITAMDFFTLQDNGPYNPQGDYRSAGSMASPQFPARGLPVARHHRCSPTRRRAPRSGHPAACR